MKNSYVQLPITTSPWCNAWIVLILFCMVLGLLITENLTSENTWMKIHFRNTFASKKKIWKDTKSLQSVRFVWRCHGGIQRYKCYLLSKTQRYRDTNTTDIKNTNATDIKKRDTRKLQYKDKKIQMQVIFIFPSLHTKIQIRLI